MDQPSRHRRTGRGAVAVEFALIVPIIILLVFGIITYGYMLSFRQAVSQAAAEGARAAAVWPTAYAASQDTDRKSAAIGAVNDSIGYGLSCTSTGPLACTASIANCPSDSSRKCATVSLSYDYEAKPLVPRFFALPVPKEITHSSVIEVS